MVEDLRNELLDAYRARTGEDLSLEMEAVSLPSHAVIYTEDSRPRYVHFVTSGVVSIVTAMPDGDAIEVGMSGRENFPEAMFLLGPLIGPRRGVVQVPGTALRMRFRDLEQQFANNHVLRGLILRAVQCDSSVLAQLVACNGMHFAEQRLARWLLMVQDRTGSAELPLTQDFLGQMLGARRSTVTLAAQTLQRTGVIEYHRGMIQVLSREGLEKASCDCYRVIRELRDKLYV